MEHIILTSIKLGLVAWGAFVIVASTALALRDMFRGR